MKKVTFMLCLVFLGIQVFCSTGRTELKKQDTPGWIPNLGQIHNQQYQANSQVTHLWSSGKGLNVQLRANGLSYDTYAPSSTTFSFHRLDMTFVGSNPNAEAHHEEAFGEIINVYNPLVKNGITTQQYRKVVLGEIYPGVDVVCAVTEEKRAGVKYDLVVHPNAELSQIRMKYEGFDAVEVKASEIHFTLSGRTLVESIPESWIAPGKRKAEVHYRVIEQTNDYIILGLEWNNPVELSGEQTLVVDPMPYLEWGTYYGDTIEDAGLGVAVDTLGKVHMCGKTQALINIATSGSFQSEYNGGNSDAFLAKFNGHGMRIWSTYLGGSGDDVATSVSVNGLFEIFITGYTTSNDSLASDGAFQPENAGETDAFVAKFDSTGTRIWTTFLGGAGADTTTACVADTSNNVYIGGYTNSGEWLSNGDVEPQYPYSGGTDAFIARLDTGGNVTWSTYYGGADDDFGLGLAVDSLNYIYLTGSTFSSEGIATEGTHQSELAGDQDAFAVCFNPDGTRKWGTYFGGEEMDVASSIVHTKDGVFAVGHTRSSSGIADSLAHQPVFGGQEDVFVFSIDSVGSLKWSTYIGDTLTEISAAITTDLEGYIYITGTTNSENSISQNPPSSSEDVHQDWIRGESEVFVNKFDSAGTRIWGTYYGGFLSEQAADIAVYGYTAVYITGHTNSEYFITYLTQHQDSLAGGVSDAYLARLTMEKSTPASYIECNGGGGGGGSGGGSDFWNSDDNGPPDAFLVCYGDSVQLSVAGGALAQDHHWVWYSHGCGGDGDFEAIGGTVWLTPDTNTTYYVRAEGGSNYSTCVKVNIIAVPPPTATASVTSPLCVGDTLHLSAEAGQYYAYQWTGPDSLHSNEQITIIDSVSTANAGMYVLEVMNAPSCYDADTVYVEIMEYPEYSVSITAPMCAESSDGEIVIQYSDSLDFQIEWLGHPDAGDTLIGLNEGYYLLTVSGEGFCSSGDSIFVEAPASMVDTTFISHTSCGLNDGAIEIVLNDANAGGSVEWSIPEITGLLAGDLAAGNYEVVVQDSTGCSETFTFTIESSVGISAEWSEITPVSCPGENDGHLTVEFSNNSGPFQITWSTGDSIVTTLDSLSAGNYSVEITDSAGCHAALAAVLETPEAISVDAVLSPEMCGNSNGSIQLTTVPDSVNVHYFWLHNGSPEPDQQNLPAGEYSVEITDSAGCLYAETYIISDEGYLEVEVIPGGAEIELGDSVALLAVVTPDSLEVNYFWTPSAGLSCTDCPDPVASPDSSIIYTLTVLSDAGCEATADVRITVGQRCAEFFVPDIFSPNGDGLNDEFCVFGGCIDELQMKVYNRWGELVFETQDPQYCWDGRFNGAEILTGSLLYTVTATLTNGERIVDSGSLIIQR